MIKGPNKPTASETEPGPFASGAAAGYLVSPISSQAALYLLVQISLSL